MGNLGYMQEVILQNPTQPCDFPQGMRIQLVHVAHNCIIDIKHGTVSIQEPMFPSKHHIDNGFLKKWLKKKKKSFC